MIAGGAGDTMIVERYTEMGDGKAGTRKRAGGVRGRIMSCLRAAGEITEPSGLASAVLAKAVGYPGSSVAFAQLLSGMERDGLIEREIRGRRTYRIRLAGDGATPARSGEPAQGAASASGTGADSLLGAEALLAAVPARGGQETGPGASGAADFDYDELARRLLTEVVWRIAAPDEVPAIARPLPGSSPAPWQADLARTLVSLERRLASIQSRQRTLSAENARLREELAAAQRSLAEIQDAGSPGGRLDPAEQQVLERLLSSLHAAPARPPSAEAG
jgi:hypothetical protein